MLWLLLNLLLLVSACVAIHTGGMLLGARWLQRLWPHHETEYMSVRTFFLIVRVVYGLLLLHLLQITIWAVFYLAHGCFADFDTSFYFSATSYSTLGYGDVLLTGESRIFGAIEAVTGILMFGWSTGILFTVVHHLLSHLFRRMTTGQAKP